MNSDGNTTGTKRQLCEAPMSAMQKYAIVPDSGTVPIGWNLNNEHLMAPTDTRSDSSDRSPEQYLLALQTTRTRNTQQTLPHLAQMHAATTMPTLSFCGLLHSRIGGPVLRPFEHVATSDPRMGSVESTRRMDATSSHPCADERSRPQSLTHFFNQVNLHPRPYQYMALNSMHEDNCNLSSTARTTPQEPDTRNMSNSSRPIVGLAGCQESKTVTSFPITLSHPSDDLVMNEHQVLLRQQIEVFVASEAYVMMHISGRHRNIRLGQVGIRCRHCAHFPNICRPKSSAYFPANTLGVYQAAQNLSSSHIQCGLCPAMPEKLKIEFARLIPTKKKASKAGRTYWAERAKQLGLVDTENGIRVGQGSLQPRGPK